MSTLGLFINRGFLHPEPDHQHQPSGRIDPSVINNYSIMTIEGSVSNLASIKTDDPMDLLQKDLEVLLGEYSKDGKIFNISVKNTEKIDKFARDYEALVKSRLEMDGTITKELTTTAPILLTRYKDIISEISTEYYAAKEVLLKSNKEIAQYYFKLEDLLDTVKHLKSKNYGEDVTSFLIEKMKVDVLKLQDSKVIAELKTEADKAAEKIYEIGCIVKQPIGGTDGLMCFCGENPIKMALVPCGHTFCEGCISSGSTCHFCRDRFTSKMKLYFN